jgi:hypothetical protein
MTVVNVGIGADYLKLEPEALRKLARQVAEKVAATGANTVSVSGYGGGYGLFTWHSTDRFERLETIFKVFVDEFHKRNLKVFYHYWTSGIGRALIEKDPKYQGNRLADWLQIDARTMAPAFLEEEGKLGRLCHNNPEYRKATLDHALWLAAAGFDGLMIDDVQHKSSYCCVCPSCRKKFKKYSGKALPLPAEKHPEFWCNFDNPLWREWIRFRFASVNAMHEDIQTALSRNGYRIAQFACCSGSSGCWEAQEAACTYEEYMRGCNLVWHECYGLHQDNWSRPAVEVKLFSGVANRYACPSVTQVSRTETADEFFRWAFCRSLATIPQPPEDGILPKWNLDLFHRPRSLANIAVLFSKQTRNVSPDIDNNFYVNEWAGWCQALLEANVPFDVILDDDLADGDLAKYALLIMPNARCLSRRQVKSVERFVGGGGDLIVTHETGLCDQDGRRLDNFSLSKLLGLRYERTISEVNVPVVVSGEHALTRGMPKVIENTEPQVLARAEAGISIHAKLKRYFGGDLQKQSYNNLEAIARPALALNLNGKGRVLYFSGKPGAMRLWPRYETGYMAKLRNFMPGPQIPAYDRLMLNSVRYLMGENLPLKIENASGLMVNAYEIGDGKAGKRRAIVHFLRVAPTEGAGEANLSLTLRTGNEYANCELLSPDVEKKKPVRIVNGEMGVKIAIPAGDVNVFMKRYAVTMFTFSGGSLLHKHPRSG